MLDDDNNQIFVEIDVINDLICNTISNGETNGNFLIDEKVQVIFILSINGEETLLSVRILTGSDIYYGQY